MTVPSQDRALKSLFRALVAEAGGLEAATSCVRVGRSRLAEYYAAGTDAFAPVDVVARLEAVVGKPLVTAELARRAGCVISEIGGTPGERLDRLLHRAAAEMGEVHGAYGEALADGRICEDDRARIAHEVADLRRVVDALAARLQQGGVA